MDFAEETKVCILMGGRQTPSYHVKPFVIRNIALLAVLEKNEKSWKSVLPFKHFFFVEMLEKEEVPEMKFFRRLPFHIPPRNRFIQLLHNVIAYQGLPWLNEFLCDEASSVTGTYYMVAGVGPVSSIKFNMSRWSWEFSSDELLLFACKGQANLEVCLFLISKGAKITDEIRKLLINSGKETLLKRLI